MSNKNLLNEGTIRRFMKLAEIDSLANPFVDRINENEEEIYEAEEDDLADMSGAEAFGAGAASAEEEAGDEPEMDMGDEEMPDDMGMDMDDEGLEGGDDPMAEIGEAIADAVTDTLQQMVDDGTLEISQGEDTDEVDLDAEPEGGEEMEMADIEVSDEEPEEELAESDALKRLTTPWSKEVKACIDAGGQIQDCEKKGKAQANEANIVAEVARRVTKRLLASR